MEGTEEITISGVMRLSIYASVKSIGRIE